MYIKYWQMEVAGIRANGLEKGGHGLCYVNTFYGNTAMLIVRVVCVCFPAATADEGSEPVAR